MGSLWSSISWHIVHAAFVDTRSRWKVNKIRIVCPVVALIEADLQKDMVKKADLEDHVRGRVNIFVIPHTSWFRLINCCRIWWKFGRHVLSDKTLHLQVFMFVVNRENLPACLCILIQRIQNKINLQSDVLLVMRLASTLQPWALHILTYSSALLLPIQSTQDPQHYWK